MTAPNKSELLHMLGGIWKVAPVDKQPQVRLRNWQIKDVKTEDDINTTRHLIGYDVDCPQGRVSSSIVTFDPSTGKCVTQSGRVYTLEGPPGIDPDASYVWSRWMHLNGVVKVTDVTNEIYEQIRAVAKTES